MKFEFEGMDQLIQQAENLGRAGIEFQDEALQKAGQMLQEEVKKRTPVQTGNLKKHIMLSKVKDGEIEVYVDNQGKAYYGAMVEFGTSKMRAQPFMHPAFIKSRLKLQKTIVDTLRIRLGLME